MTKNLLCIGILAVLAACTGSKPVPVDAKPGSDVVATANPSVKQEDQRCANGYSPLPKGVVLAPFHVRSDRIYTTKVGAERRRATLELLEGGTAAAADDVSKQMAASGFRSLGVEDKGDGMIRLAFLKKDAGRINVTASSDVGDKPSNPHAVGLIMFDWQLAPAPASAPVAASPEQNAPVDQPATGG